MSRFYERFIDLCAKVGKSPSVVVSEIGMNKSAASNWNRGKNDPSMRTIEKVASYFGVDTSYFTGAEEAKSAKEAHSLDEFIDMIGEENIAVMSVPILGNVAAGEPMYSEENIEGWTFTDRIGGDYFALRVHGDSMDMDGIRDSSLIIVHKQDVLEPGEVGVICVDDDEYTIKRLETQGSMAILIPHSTNPDNKPQIYSLLDHKLTVIGKVVEVQYRIS